MITKIIPFPSPKENPGEKIDEYIRLYLAETFPDKDFINYVGNRMKDFVEQYASHSFEPTFELIVPLNLSLQEADALLSSIDKGVQSTAEEVQGMITKIILERLHLEIELYTIKKNIKYRLC